MRRRYLAGLLAAALALFFFSLPALAEDGAFHQENKYLTDTLTLAGSGFGEVRTLTVAALEGLFAADDGLAYTNEYSTMTSGSVFAKHTFSGVLLYPLLLREGLDADLPDSTPVQLIAKDGYCIYLTLGDLRSDKYGRYAAKGGVLEEGGLPALVAFASDGKALVGPTGSESVYKVFTAEDGYDEVCDNIGGPLRLIVGQTSSLEFNAPYCAKWLAAIVVGDADGYVYHRDGGQPMDDSQPEQSGDWTHQGSQADFRLVISGTEADGIHELSLARLESDPRRLRQYFAASGGRFAFEGLPLRALIEDCLAPGLSAPSQIRIKAADGMVKTINVSTVYQGVDSFYQPGQQRDVVLAWAVDGSPLVADKNSPGYDGTNAFGPLRLVVENTISLWIKSVTEIVLGEENTSPYRDVAQSSWYYEDVCELYRLGLMQGSGGLFDPEGRTSRAMIVTILYRLAGSPQVSGELPFSDVAEDSWYAGALLWAGQNGVARGDGGRFRPDDPVSRQELAALLYRACNASPGGTDLSVFSDGAQVAEWAVPAMQWAVAQGILKGDAGRLLPAATASRCQTAAVVNRYRSL
ncbi:MAG: S-layer homology domain-containing protein [Firmicutes bacterium]|nr:S-layer homology domain-containing protein [Bacillota bacterium]